MRIYKNIYELAFVDLLYNARMWNSYTNLEFLFCLQQWPVTVLSKCCKVREILHYLSKY